LLSQNFESRYLFEDNTSEVVSVLSDTFYDYPVMGYVLGNKYNYKERLHKLIGFFVEARVLRKEPMLGVYNSEYILVAAAIVTLPGNIPAPEKLIERRKKLWQELGSEEQKRYEFYGNAAGALQPPQPHHHLNMIGVIPKYKGKGLARMLIDAIEELVRTHPNSSGLSLNTETESNVKLYLHLGFKLIAHAKVDDNLETRAFFKSK
jgi:ribosomal protein S18 acetylase RimI-like enzyme